MIRFSEHDVPPLLAVRGLFSSYISRNFGLFGKKKIQSVLKGIDFEIAPKEIFGLTGESGCGKSTLARCILGLIDYEGEISIDGKNRKHREKGRSLPPVQMIFQESGASLNPAKKIGWLMEEPLVIHRLGTARERAKKTDEMLVRAGLDPSYKNRRVNELSGGQKQRVCIGRVLLLSPRLLVADEAVSSLDVSTGAQILNLFRELHENMGLSILFISHNIDAVEYLCGRIAVMSEGKIEIR